MLLDWLPLLPILAIFFFVWWRRSRVRDARRATWREPDGYSSRPTPDHDSGGGWDDGGAESGDAGGDSDGDGGTDD